MKKKLLKSLLLIAGLFSSITVSAYDFENGGIYYNITSESDKTVEVTYRAPASNCYSGSISIPETVTNGATTYSITEIGTNAFRECEGLTSVRTGNKVTKIGQSAFLSSFDLANVTIGNSVTYIGANAFRECESLISVSIPNSVTEIGQNAFTFCTSLPSITIPNSVYKIEEGTFAYCKNLVSVTIPNSVTEIDAKAFSYCTGLTEIYNYNEWPQIIPADVFEGIDKSTVALYVPTGRKATYSATDVWKEFYIQEFDAPTGVEAVSGDAVNIAVVGNTITINGAAEVAKITVYGINGELVYSGTAKSITVHAHGVYIVRVAGVTKKVTL